MENPARFVLYIAVTLDGFIARSDGSIDWLPLAEPESEDYGYVEFYNSMDALVMGSTTYEQILGFGDWPYPGKCAYILTSRDLSTERDDIVFFHNLEAVLADIQQKGFQSVWIVGGGRLASQFMTQGLISEYILAVIPIILGTGISLYQTVTEQRLQFIASQSYGSGVVELHYRRV